MNPARQEAEAFIIKVISTQDPSGYNEKVYRTFFDNMTDEDFDKWMTTLRDDRNAKLTILAVPFKVVLDLGASFKTAELLGIPVFEKLKLWDSIEKRYVTTPEKYLILRLPVRRLKQYLQDGLSVPDSDRRLNPLTDQVVGKDKSSAFSYPQAQMIAEKGLYKVLHELLTTRGGDLEAYSRTKASIEETGYADATASEDTAGVKSAQTLRTFLNAMHLSTNL